MTWQEIEIAAVAKLDNGWDGYGHIDLASLAIKAETERDEAVARVKELERCIRTFHAHGPTMPHCHCDACETFRSIGEKQ